MTTEPRPPRLALWLCERSLPLDDRDAVVGDLCEGFVVRAAQSPAAARRWVWSQTCRSLLPNLHRRLFGQRPRQMHLPSGGCMLTGFLTDARFAVRLLRRQPLMSIVALVSLSAGLGLNVLLVSIADVALFRTLPLRAPHDLVLLLLQRESGVMHNFSYPDYLAMRDRSRRLESLVAYAGVAATVSQADGAVPVDGEVVSGNFFTALGVPMTIGRPLAPGDDRLAAPPAVVIAEHLWRDRLGGEPPSGQILRLNGEPYAVVGVASARFAGMEVGRRASFWVPLAHARPVMGDDLLGRETVSWLTVLGRLRAGTHLSVARDELDAVLSSARKASGRSVEPLVLEAGGRGDSMLAQQLASPLLLLLGAGAVVFLVACLNVANLQIARTDTRQAELAVRAALGAKRAQLIRLVLIDSLLVALTAGAFGLWLAAMVKDSAVALIAFYGQPVSLPVPLDLRTFLAAAALALGGAIVIGLLQAFQLRGATGRTLGDVRAASPARRRTQQALVVSQVALSMALVTGATMLARTLDSLRDAHLGFDPRGVAVVQVSPEMGRLTRAQSLAYFDEAIAAVSAMPGVSGAAVSHVMPLAFGGSRTSLEIAGYTPAPDEDMEINFVRVTPGYFSVLGMPVLQGRAFDAGDRDGRPERIIVNATMARRFWPDGRAVGGLVRFDGRQPFTVEVVGVVPDVHYRMVREDPHPSFYVPLAQMPASEGVLHVRFTDGAGRPSAAAAGTRIDELRRVVSAVNPAVPVVRAHTLTDQIERNISQERMALAIGATLALIALLLATGGLYAAMAFVVGRRTREIGVRIALGARRIDVRGLVLREGAALAATGVAVGLALSAWTGQALRARLYGVSAMDGVSFAAAAAILGAAALAASWMPAQRASNVDPVVALRDR